MTHVDETSLEAPKHGLVESIGSTSRPKDAVRREVMLWGLWTGLLWALLTVWRHAVQPVGLGCEHGIRFFSCAATLVPTYNQIFGVPWAFIGLVGSAIALYLAYIPRYRTLLIWLLLGVVPLGYLRGLELRLLGGICPLCWLVFLSWLVALAAIPMYLRRRRLLALASVLLLFGVVSGLVAAPLYPDPEVQTRELLESRGWNVVDLRDTTEVVAVNDGPVVIFREGCPYCHAFAARTLSRFTEAQGVVFIVGNERDLALNGSPGGAPKLFPTLRQLEGGQVVAEHGGFLTLKNLNAWWENKEYTQAPHNQSSS